MHSQDRWNQILLLLKRNSTITISELQMELYVSESTVRRDLVKLEKLGLLKRTHGGAILPESNVEEHSSNYRMNLNRKAKKNIAELCSPLINDHSTIFLDSSSTVGVLCEYLHTKSDLKIITNGINNARIISEHLDCKVYLPGGYLYPKTNSIIGDNTCTQLNEFHCDYFIFSSSGFSMEVGITEASHEQRLIKQTMLKNADTVIYLADYSKRNKNYIAKITQFENIDYFITDSELPDRFSKSLNEANVKIIWNR